MLFLDPQKIYLKPCLLQPDREEKANKMPVQLRIYFCMGDFQGKNMFKKNAIYNQKHNSR